MQAVDVRAKCEQRAKPATPDAARARNNRKKARAIWLKQLHTWHWVSAAVSLAGMLLFAITGITLNHAASIGAEPKVTRAEAVLPAAAIEALKGEHPAAAPLPAAVASAVEQAVKLDPSGRPGEWSDGEVYVAMPGPGSDAWVSVDRATGKVSAETTWRGWISYLNDLHKGRNTGGAWFWFIDAFAVACIVFTSTGLLLLQLHAKHRPATWPMVAISLIVPLLIALFFIH